MVENKEHSKINLKSTSRKKILASLMRPARQTTRVWGPNSRNYNMPYLIQIGKVLTYFKYTNNLFATRYGGKQSKDKL